MSCNMKYTLCNMAYEKENIPVWYKTVARRVCVTIRGFYLFNREYFTHVVLFEARNVITGIWYPVLQLSSNMNIVFAQLSLFGVFLYYYKCTQSSCMNKNSIKKNVVRATFNSCIKRH